MAVAAVPVGIVVAESVDELRLLHATVSVPVGAVIGLLAIALARRARGRIQLTLGRVGGERTAWVGRALGLLGIYLAATAGLAVAFYGLLELFAS